MVAHRVPRGESVVGPRSRCPGCGTQIAAYDNVPVFSWLLLRGRGRCCGERISARYPLTELALGAALRCSPSLVLRDDPDRDRARARLRHALVAVTVTDLERRIIPNKILAGHGGARRGDRRRQGSGQPAGAGDRRRRGAAACSSPPRSPTRAGWGWATSSSPR